MKTWMCVVCGLIYDEEQGWPEEGIAPGTRWEDVPSDWTCPECGVPEMWAEQSLRGCSRREHRRLLVHAGDNERAGFGGRDQSTLRVRCVRDISGIKNRQILPV